MLPSCRCCSLLHKLGGIDDLSCCTALYFFAKKLECMAGIATLPSADCAVICTGWHRGPCSSSRLRRWRKQSFAILACTG